MLCNCRGEPYASISALRHARSRMDVGLFSSRLARPIPPDPAKPGMISRSDRQPHQDSPLTSHPGPSRPRSLSPPEQIHAIIRAWFSPGDARLNHTALPSQARQKGDAMSIPDFQGWALFRVEWTDRDSLGTVHELTRFPSGQY
jgi:hypothetical protein